MKEASFGLSVDEIQQKLEHYCAYQDRCHWEVEKKLNEFFLIPQARDTILIHLIEENYLNEERFAKSFVRGKFNQKKWGKRKISQELRKRKIVPNLIKIALQEIDFEEYSIVIQGWITKKSIDYKAEKNPYKKKQKIVRFLLQKGFEYDLILAALQSN